MQAFEVHATTKFENPPPYSCFNAKEHGSNVDTQTTQPTERITVYIVVSCVFLSTLIPYSNAELLG